MFNNRKIKQLEICIEFMEGQIDKMKRERINDNKIPSERGIQDLINDFKDLIDDTRKDIEKQVNDLHDNCHSIKAGQRMAIAGVVDDFDEEIDRVKQEIELIKTQIGGLNDNNQSTTRNSGVAGVEE